MMTTEFTPKRRDGMEFSRTHAHYMAAVKLFSGDSEPLVAEMYELAQDLEAEVTFLRARLDAVAAEELPAPEKPRRLLRTWLASLLRPWTAQGVERAVHGLVLTMAAGLIVGALVLPVDAHASDGPGWPPRNAAELLDACTNEHDEFPLIMRRLTCVGFVAGVIEGQALAYQSIYKRPCLGQDGKGVQPQDVLGMLGIMIHRDPDMATGTARMGVYTAAAMFNECIWDQDPNKKGPKKKDS